ncbi:glycerophosphodiester phosphodiesterase [Paludifilum halophilum]|uniref:Glycerophosphodiester phosphodiesterase n=2 Tax=Paludifilum halophilum TaxID=1642702 RepID=A0A235BAB5_9BACL|nr:glycerophosphodiester phosphodiesterase [Paludifilum halophilum]
MAAFEKAVEMKSDYFELDVQRSRDGKLVVMHDTTVDRTTDGTGQVRDLTLKQLKSLDAGSWFSPEFRGERIPTLEEVLDRFRGTRAGILIELKSPELYPGIEAQVAHLLKKKRMHKRHGKVIVQSFNHQSMKRYHRLQPTVPVGVLVSYTQYKDGITDEELKEFTAYADYVNPNKALVDSELVDRIHRRNMKILPYTVRNQESADQLIQAGVDGIITDFPELGYR